MKLGIKLIILFVTMGIIPLAVLGGLSIHQAGQALSDQAFNQLKAVRQIKKSQIESFFAERLGDIRVLANNPFTLAAAKDLSRVFLDGGGVGGKRFSGQTREQYTAPASYQSVHDRYFPVFK